MRVASPRAEKVASVAAVAERLSSAEAVFVTEYRGLKVHDLERLRVELRESGAEYKIFKNTLARIAAREQGLDALEELLVGPTGLVFAHADVATTAKRLRDFARANPALVIRGGMISGSVFDERTVAQLASLPSREVLLAQLAGALAAPLSACAGVLSALPRNLAYGLKALQEERAA
jgi:large subunit ribosomal protein L10